jgi:hypothetical protein
MRSVEVVRALDLIFLLHADHEVCFMGFKLDIWDYITFGRDFLQRGASVTAPFGMVPNTCFVGSMGLPRFAPISAALNSLDFFVGYVFIGICFFVAICWVANKRPPEK